MMKVSEMVRTREKQQGFTLMEMLIVVMIMGFLVAMIAPRFMGLFSGAQQTMCKKNSQSAFKALEAYVFETGGLPDNLTSLMVLNGTTYQAPALYDGQNAPEDTGKDVNKGLYAKNAMRMHTLSAAEAGELVSLGITKISPIRQVNGTQEFFNGDFVDVAAGVCVAMIGASAATDNGTISAWAPTSGARGLGVNKYLPNPEMAYRMVLCLGPDNELVTTGKIDQVGIGMGQAVKDDDEAGFHCAYHTIVLPRLEATVDRLATAAPRKITVEGYDGTGSGAKKIKGKREWQIDVVQSANDYDVLSNCGTTWQERNERMGAAEWLITAAE